MCAPILIYRENGSSVNGCKIGQCCMDQSQPGGGGHMFLMSWFVLQVIDEYSNDVHFVEIDIEEDPEIAEAGGIMGTPCVQFFRNKQMIKYVIKSLLA